MIRISEEILRQAKQQGYNISKVCENALKQKLTPNNQFFGEAFFGKKGSMEPRAGFEPATSALPRQCPTRLGHRGMVMFWEQCHI